MSAEHPLQELEFYADEEGDDFTFYLARDEENSVLSSLEWKRAKERLRLGLPAQLFPDRGFSFAERIKVNRLEGIKDGFWKKLRHPSPGSAHAYLISQLKTRAQEKRRSSSTEESKKAKAALTTLRKLQKGERLRANDKSELRPLLALTLNNCIHNDDLREQPWAERLVERMKKHSKRELDAAGNDEAQKRRSWNRALIEKGFPGLKRQCETGRALICLSKTGEYLSVTFRKLTKSSGYEASDKKEPRKNLFSLREYCEPLYRELFRKTRSSEVARGLLVITGSTNSAKSEIARGLIHLYLSRNKQSRRQHLVTFEDPIERLFTEDVADGHPWVAVEMSAQSHGSDYSPREKARDVGLLKEGLTDALRQSPAVVFVGETREKEEWATLLDFAATGHLIVTTAHAGSLLEAMHKVFEALEVKTPEDRSEVANKLLGIVHLRKDSVVFEESAAGDCTTGTLFPALWRRTARGVAALTSDGLASLLPYRPKTTLSGKRKRMGRGGPRVSESELKDQVSCLGRRWFIEQLLEAENMRDELDATFTTGAYDSIRREAYKKATNWDLQGV
jgi:hypothetical protein